MIKQLKLAYFYVKKLFFFFFDIITKLNFFKERKKMIPKKPKLAICFFGHLRTYKQTYQSFFENIIKPNEKEWDIDIFIHTWDEFEKSGFTWHNHFKELDRKKVEQKDITEVESIYKPKKFLVETLMQDRGEWISYPKVQELARIYAKEQNFEYDYTLVTRPDLYFYTALRLKLYIDFYEGNEDMKSVAGGGVTAKTYLYRSQFL